MKNGPFADVFPVENGDSIAMSIYQRVCGFTYAKSQSCWDFSPCFSSPGPSWLESRSFKPRLRFLRHGCFCTPPKKKKKTLGEISPKWEEKETWLQIQHLLHSCWQQNCFFLEIYTCWICFRKNELPIFQPTCENKLLWIFIHFTPKTSNPVA